MFSKTIAQNLGSFLTQVYRLAVVAAAIQFFTVFGFAQSTFGEFVGIVRDPSGALMPGCTITVRNLGTSATRTAVVDDTGSYAVVNLEPGDYEITMQHPGFQKVTRSNVQLLSRQTVRVDGVMQVGSQAQTVDVSSEAAAPIATEVSNIAETKLGRELIDLPVALGSRASGSTSAFSTLSTIPGVEVDNSGQISVAGSNVDMVSMSVDGISTVSAHASSPISELFPSFDGIAEVRVSEINNTAEFSGVSDITTISKGGSNEFHGGVFENHQNSYFAARNVFSATVPKLIMNDFGAFGGGPIRKDKTFFFMDYEGLRLPLQVVLVENVPSLALRSGDLSVYPNQIYDVDGTPFQGNQIPASKISPLSANMLTYLWPLPNAGPPNATTLNYVTNFPTPISSNQGDVRVDHNLSSKQSVFGRLTLKHRETNLPPCGACGGGNGQFGVSGAGTVLAGPLRVPETDYSLMGAHNWVISPRVVNEFRAGWTGIHSTQSNGILASKIEDELGLTPYIPTSRAQLEKTTATPNVRISGFQWTGGIGARSYNSGNLQFLDNVTLVKTKHTWKMGGDFRYLTAFFATAYATSMLGQYRFNNSVTGVIGNPFAAFLLGIPDNQTIADAPYPTADTSARHWAFYAQDDWKVTRRLTINYGLRWEYHPMFVENNGNTANFLPDRNTEVNGVNVPGAVVIPNGAEHLTLPAFAQSIAPTPILTADQAGVPNSVRYSSKKDFNPRIGFAWRATADSKTVLRGGWGKYIDAPLGDLVQQAYAIASADVATFTNSITNGTAQYTFPYPFPANLALPGTEDFNSTSDLHYKDPYVQQWNFTIERDLGFQTGLRLSYDGSRGTNLGVQEDLTQVPANTIGYAQASQSRPFPLWGSVVNQTTLGRSNYQAFTISVNKRLSKGLQFLFSYNHAKNLSNSGGWNPTSFVGEGGNELSDRFHPNVDYGRVPFTRSNRVIANFLYETSSHSSSRLINQLYSGWEVAGRMMFQTGPYLTVLAPGTDPSGTNFDNSNNGGDPRADIIPGVPLYPANRSINQWLNPAAFGLPPDNIGRFGDSPVGSAVGPGTQVVSLSIYRSIKYKERATFRIGASAANLFNHPNYGVPNVSLGDASFGTISSMQSAEDSGPRAIQFGARLTF
jgi:hypothetical protein